jgi:hypothetical protein
VNISEVADYKSRYGIENVINQLKTRIDFGGKVTILTDDAKYELHNLARSNITRINFSQFAEVVSGLALMGSGLALLFCSGSVLNSVGMKMALEMLVVCSTAPSAVILIRLHIPLLLAVAYRGGCLGVSNPPPTKKSEVLTKLS